MAPKGMKRPAGNQPTLAKCRKIASSLEEGTLPSSVQSMLGGMLSMTLAVYKEDRHEFQASVVAMVEESLSDIKKSLQEDVALAQAKVDGSEEDRLAREKMQKDQEAALVAAKESVTEKKALLAAAKEAEKVAAADLAKAEEDQKSGDAGLETASSDKAEIQEALKGPYTFLKDGLLGGIDAKKCMKQLDSLGKKFSLDTTLMASLSNSLKVEAASRTDFDALAMAHFEKVTASKIEELQATIDSGLPAKQERAANVEGAKAKLETCKNTHADAKTNLAAAVGGEKECEKSLKAATKSVKSFLPDLQEMADCLDSAKLKLKGFEDGSWLYFSELKDLTPPPQEPEEEAKPIDVGEVAVEQAAEVPANAEPSVHLD